MKTENELIAEFMGLRRQEPGEYNLVSYWRIDPSDKRKKHFVGYIEQLKYDTSWDWLIPVVQKISEYRLAYPDQANEVCNLKVVVMQQVLYRRVVEFINWYNSTLK